MVNILYKYIYILISSSQYSSKCCCSISSVILIVSSIDLGGNLYNTRIDIRIILFNRIN